MSKINLDNCSTTKPYNEILELFIDLNKKFYFNANSGSNDAYKTNIILQRSKEKIKQLVEFNGDIIHTSGATESNNVIIQGFFKNNVNRINKFISTKIEHPSIYNLSKNLDDSVEVEYVDFVDEKIDLVQLENLLIKGPALVSFCLVNNNTGTIIEYNKVYELVKKYNSFLHLDITQALCKIPLDYSQFDFASCSMHKIHGLKGVGLILKNTDAKLENIMFGGGSDSDLRPGTINTPGYITASRTIELSLNKFDKTISKICELNLYTRERLSKFSELSINTKYDNTSPFIINFSSINIGSEVLLNFFEKNDLIISSGSACSTKVKSKTEEIMKEFGVKYPKNNIRICFEYDTTKEEIDYFFNILERALNEL